MLALSDEAVEADVSVVGAVGLPVEAVDTVGVDVSVAAVEEDEDVDVDEDDVPPDDVVVVVVSEATVILR